eukprot:3191271-Pleurochrysis_carterae.AAC.1
MSLAMTSRCPRFDIPCGNCAACSCVPSVIREASRAAAEVVGHTASDGVQEVDTATEHIGAGVQEVAPQGAIDRDVMP